MRYVVTTVYMARPRWFVQLLKSVFPTRHLIAKMTRMPVIGKIVDKMLFDGDDIIYLPRDSIVRQRIQVGRDIVQPTDMVLPSQVIHHFIDQAEYHWIMNFCICRDAMKCKDYPIEYGCLFLGAAAMGINPQLGRRVTREEAHEYIRRCDEAGLVHLIGRNRLDAVWLNVSPGNRLLTVCNCCPCCCLWRMLPHLNPQIGRKVTKMPSVNVYVTDRCVGCGTCVNSKICFVDAIHIITNKRAVIDEQCRGCGRCVEVCPQHAIELTIDVPESVKHSIERVSSAVDVR